MTQAQLQRVPRGPSKSRRDVDRLTQLIWNRQEVQRLGFPTIGQLQTLSTWPWPRFVKALDAVLEDPESGVYITRAGAIGYTWELTEEDLRRCRERVDRLRQERRARSRS